MHQGYPRSDDSIVCQCCRVYWWDEIIEGSTTWLVLGGCRTGEQAHNIVSEMQLTLFDSQQFWPVMFAGYKLWPAVNVLQHTLIPVNQKTLVGSLVGLGWGTYLAMIAG